MKARQQSLHDQRGQSRAFKEAHAQELHNVRMAEGAHQLTFPHKLGRQFVDFFTRNFGAVLEDIVDLFNDGTYRYRHLLYAAVSSSADSSASEPHVGERERSQHRVVTEKTCCHPLKSAVVNGRFCSVYVNLVPDCTARPAK